MPHLSIAMALLSSQQLPVFPLEARALDPQPLPALIESLLPDAGQSQLAWTHGINASISWVTRGYEAAGNRYERVGLARVTVDGEFATLLEREVNEIAWTVTLQTSEPAKFGPTMVEISPGPPGSSCFGDLFTGCFFTVQQALATLEGVSTKICDRDLNTGNGVAVFRLRTRTKLGYIRYYSNTGSAGQNSWVEISPNILNCG